MRRIRRISVEEEIAVAKEREAAIVKKENKYWAIFDKYIPAVLNNYRTGHVGSCLTLQSVMSYPEALHFLYWKRAFGDMLHNVKKEDTPFDLHIIFHLGK